MTGAPRVPVVDALGVDIDAPRVRRLLAVVAVFILAELAILFRQIVFGLLLHGAMLLVLFWMIAQGTDHRVFEALVFVPLLRLLNLGTGIISFNPFLWLVGVYGLLFASMVVSIRGHGVTAADLGLTWPQSLRHWGYIVAGVVAGTGCGAIQWAFDLETLPVAPTLQNAVLSALILGGLVGFVEEVLYRGLLQQWAAELVSTRAAILLVSLLFGFMHSIWFNLGDVVFATVISVVIGVVYARTRNFWSIWAIHAVINVMAFAVFPLLFG